jgi:sortase A
MLESVQRCLWMAGFIVLGYCGMAWINATLQQTAGNAELNRLISSYVPDTRQPAPSPRGLVGRIEISRLHLSAVIFEGTEEPVLRQGVGHLRGSAMPGQNGNVVLAGHRDSFFRALRNIRSGDVVDVTTLQGTRSYAIGTTRIIQPTEVGVLAPTRVPTLTLVTCYPFYYVGNAPQRFIVRGTEQRQIAQR